MKLTKKEIQHIANLARLELTEAEQKKYGSQLLDILNYIDQLKGADTLKVEPTAQVTGLENVFREDKIEVSSKDEIQAALKQAPKLENGQIMVKRILD